MADSERIAETPGDDDAGKMSFFEHLTELRTRIIWSLIPTGIGLGVALYFTNNVMRFLSGHLKTELVFTTPTEAFWTYMKVAMIGGLFIALFVIIPFAVNFLVNFGQEQGLKPMITISSYIDFIIKFTLAFGVVFELPVVITLLSMLGLVTPQFLSKNRKYAILINFIIAAILTPTPDIVNQSLMAGPLCILYELGIISARIFGRKKPAKPAITEDSTK